MSSALAEQERAVGITAFVLPDIPGFECTIKHRYTDFLVNEISTDGKVLHLTNDRVEKKRKRGPDVNGHQAKSNGSKEVDVNQSAKEELNEKRQEGSANVQDDEPESAPKKQKLELEQTSTSGDRAKDQDDGNRKTEIIASVSDADKERLHSIFGEVTTAQIVTLYANVVLRPEKKPRDQPFVRSEVISEKAKRTEAHVAVRQIFSSKLVTETIQDSPGVIAVRAAPTKGPSGARGQQNGDGNGAYQKGRLGWDELGGEYLHFTLYKENKDTMEVLFFLASQLKVPAKNFQFAGTKDRRGVTVQRVAIYRVHADRIAQLNRMARGWRVGDFEYKKHGLELGELGGNEFLLTLRDCRVDEDEGSATEDRVTRVKEAVTEAAESFKQHGFLNYFGLQRFGTFSTGTHAVGRHMLKGDLEAAIDSILAYSTDLLPENVDTSDTAKVPQDDINRADAIRIWREKGSAHDILHRLPRRFSAEAAIMQYLGKKDRKTGKLLQEKDWQGALMMIQRNLRSMYVHAYQSFVWNTVVGKRWELYCGKVVEGDLVIIGENDDYAAKKDEVDEDGEPIFHPAADDSAPTTEDSYTRARHLSKEEAESGKYSIFDIVLPLPGFDVLYPANEAGKFYEEFMASEEGGGLDPHNMRRAWKDISLPGGYRKMMARPGEGFEYDIKTYSNAEEQLVETDLDRLKKSVAEEAGDAGAKANGLNQQEDTSNGAKEAAGHETAGEAKIAVVLRMKLGSSQYATMALRELTKGGAVNYKPDYSAR